MGRGLILLCATALALDARVGPQLPDCPAGCSGHGDCAASGLCDCWPGWEAADCGARACGLALSHASAALGLAECADKGLCDRSTGLCECFGGYEGEACQRPACPRVAGSLCAGHGVCRPGGRCECDAGWAAADCWERRCPRGADPVVSSWSGSFRVHMSAGGPLAVFDPFGERFAVPGPLRGGCDELMAALWALPNGAVARGAYCSELGGGGVLEVVRGHPGALRLPEGAAAGVLEGADEDRFEWAAGGAWSMVRGSRAFSTRDNATVADLAADLSRLPRLARLGGELVVVVTAARARGRALWPRGSRSADRARLALTADRVALSAATVSARFGSSLVTFSSSQLAPPAGAEIVVHNVRYTLVAEDTLDRPFAGHAVTGADVVDSPVVVIARDPAVRPERVVGECSFRGRCDRSTGLCSCFYGYSGEACESRGLLPAPTS